MAKTKNELLIKIEEVKNTLEEKREELYPSAWDVTDTLYNVVQTAVDNVIDDLYNYDYEELYQRITEIEEEELTEELSEELDNEMDELLEKIEDLNYSDELTDAVHYEMDNAFIYYSDAWDYLREERDITDFDDAFRNGCTDICSIAYYYLSEEYYGY